MAILVIIVEEIISISIDRAQHKLLGGGGGGGDLYDGLPPKVLLIKFKGSHHQHFTSKIIIITLSSSLYYIHHYHKQISTIHRRPGAVTAGATVLGPTSIVFSVLAFAYSSSSGSSYC